MSKLIFSPQWFYGIESLFDIITIIVSFAIGVSAYRFYKLSKERNYKYFSFAFFAIALSYFVKLFTYANLYLHTIISREVLGITNILYKVTSLSSIALLLHQYLLIVGLLAILVILLKTRNKILIILLLYFLTALTFMSMTAAHMIHVTAVVITFFICLKYYANYDRTKNKTTLYVLISFLALFISHILFLFKYSSATFYVVAELFQIAGYAFLLYTFMTIQVNTKKVKGFPDRTGET